jgi:hypothetical protein
MTAPKLLLIAGNAVSRIVGRKVVDRAEIDMKSPQAQRDLRANLEYFRQNGHDPEREPNDAACVHSWVADGAAVFARIVRDLVGPGAEPEPALA